MKDAKLISLKSQSVSQAVVVVANEPGASEFFNEQPTRRTIIPP